MATETKSKSKTLGEAMKGAEEESGKVLGINSRPRELTEAEIAKREKDYKKRAAMELADYKKRLRDGVELRRLQVEELELNIAYYEAKKRWMELQPAIEELDAKEQAEIQEIQRKRKEFIEEQKKEALKAKEEEAGKKKVDLVTVKQGKAREDK